MAARPIHQLRTWRRKYQAAGTSSRIGTSPLASTAKPVATPARANRAFTSGGEWRRSEATRGSNSNTASEKQTASGASVRASELKASHPAEQASSKVDVAATRKQNSRRSSSKNP